MREPPELMTPEESKRHSDTMKLVEEFSAETTADYHTILSLRPVPERWEDIDHGTNDIEQLREEFADRLYIDSE